MFHRIRSIRAAPFRRQNSSPPFSELLPHTCRTLLSSATAESAAAASETRPLTPSLAGKLAFRCFIGIRENRGPNSIDFSFTRFISSRASSHETGKNKDEPGKKGENTDNTKGEITNVDDPFSAPTYNIPEKPVTFVEGASYSVIILAGLGIAAAAGYAVFKELIFQPKEYKIYNKALKRIQDDSQVRVRIGSPITGYGQESRNRAARQRIPHRVWTDEDGVEHVEVNFYIRGPHGHGKVFSEMFKDANDNQWKFTYLIVEIRSPSTAQIILESYIPAYNTNK